jgi:hypothetical protein
MNTRRHFGIVFYAFINKHTHFNLMRGEIRGKEEKHSLKYHSQGLLPVPSM